VTDQVPALGWGHININVTDLDRSVAFYQLLGFEVYLPGIPYLGLTMDKAGVIEPSGATGLGLPQGVKARACIMQLGRSYPKIDLIALEGGDGTPPKTNADIGIVRFCLASKDLAQDHARLAKAGVAFTSPPQTDSRGLAQIAVCADPDGALIELIEVDRAKWAAVSEQKTASAPK